MMVLFRMSWYGLPFFVREFFILASTFEVLGLFCTCFWLGELFYRYATSWVVGEVIEENSGGITRRTQKIDELTEIIRVGRIQLKEQTKDNKHSSQLKHRLSQARIELRTARKYIDEMTNYFGTLPRKTRRQ